jgi:hypothetical protein
MRLGSGELDSDHAAPPSSMTVSVTCALDARTHEVREVDLAPGADQGAAAPPRRPLTGPPPEPRRPRSR